MSETFDAIVIGAGALGASMGYHLAARGLSVCIVDQFDIACQTSPRAAGLSTAISRDSHHAPLAQRSAEMITALGTEIGHAVDFVRSGVIRLTRDSDLVDNIVEEVSYGRRQGIAVEQISKERASSLAPFVNMAPVVALTYAPDELYLPEPGQLARAYALAASERGAQAKLGERVESILFSGDRATGIKTNDRVLQSDIIVLCANAGNGRLARMLGFDLPTVPMRHQLCITEPLPEVRPEHPQIKVVEESVYVRPHGNSLLIGGFEPDPLIFSHEEADLIDARNMPLDPKPLQALINRAVDVLPSLARAKFSEIRGGVVSMTADGHFILDKVPGWRNVWIVGGDNAGGNTTSPMIGKTMVEWIVDGSPSIDLSVFSLERLRHPLEERIRLATKEYVDMIALD